MNIWKEPYQPRTRQEYWCNCCDNQIVDSEQPNTGRFFLQSGHSYNKETREYDGEYSMVLFAFCTVCLNQP